MPFEEVGIRAVIRGVSQYRAQARGVARDTDQIAASAGRASTATKTFSQSLDANGRKMQESGRNAVFLGGAILGLTGATAFMAGRFDSAFVRIETLVGESGQTLDEFRGKVLDLAGETARSPQELAEALFFIESGGLRGAEALDTLEQSAKAAAIGLGDTAEIGKLTTQAIIAFRDQGLSASSAINVLVGTARAGNFETSQLAGSFGQVLPLAAELGVRFSDLGGFIAAYTRVGGNASQATTALQGVLLTLTRGGTAARETLAGLGLSLDDLRTTAQEEGLAQALFQILEAAERGGAGAEETLSAIIPNIRALRGVLATAGVQAEDFLQIQQDLRGELSLLDDGFERVSETDFFKLQQSLTELKISAIEFGAAVLPAFANFADAAVNLISVFTRLPGPVQAVAGAVAVLLGSFLVIGGTIGILVGGLLRIASVLPAVAAGFTRLNASMLLTRGSLLGLVATLGIAAGAFLLMRNAQKKAAEEALIATNANKLYANSTREVVESSLANYKIALEELQQRIKDTEDSTASGRREFDERRRKVAELREEEQRLTGIIDSHRQALNLFNESETAAARATEQLNQQLAEQIELQRTAEALASRRAGAILSEDRARLQRFAEQVGIDVRFLTTRQIEDLAPLLDQINEAHLDETSGAAALRAELEKLLDTGDDLTDVTNQLSDAELRLKAARESLAERQFQEQAEALIRELTGTLQPGGRNLAAVRSRQAALDREFAEIAPIIEERLGVVPILVRDIFDRIRDEAEQGVENFGELGGILGLLIARRIAEGQPVGSLIATPAGFTGQSVDAGTRPTVTIEQINIGEGATTTAGEVGTGVGDGVRGALGG